MKPLPWTVVVAALAAFSCRPAAQTPVPPSAPEAQTWTRGAVCYEIFVRSFADSDGNGVGDFNGLTSRLDYVNDGNPATQRDLGASCIWLMPVAESPSYHGYDVADLIRSSIRFTSALNLSTTSLPSSG